jgi:signal transduction histidine kinase/ligand-binding sensor domain-containing protein
LATGIFKTGQLLESFLCLCFAFILSITISAQPAGIKRYSVNEGLSQSMVDDILQDRQGFLWLCTGGGINSFDGYRFVAYKHIPGDSSTISSNTIRGAVEDDKGNLYVGSESGLNFFNKVTGRFSRLFSTKSELYNVCMRPLYYSNNSLVIYTRGHGIWQYDSRTKNLKLLLPANRQLANECTYADSESILFNCIDGRLGVFNREKHILFFASQPAETHALCYLHYRQNEILCGTRQGIFLLDIQKHSFSPMHINGISGKRVRSIVQDGLGQYWLAVDGEGLFLYDSHWKLLEKFDNALFPGLKHIITLAADRQNNILAGTEEEGLLVISYNNLPFKYPSEQVISNMQSKFVRAIYADDKYIYAGTYLRGLYIIGKDGNAEKQLLPKPNSKNGDESNSITAIAALKDSNKLFIGTGNGAFIYDKNTGRFDVVDFINASPATKNISACIYSNKYGLLFYSHEAVYYLIPNGKKYTAALFHGAGGTIMGLYTDRSGQLLEANVGMNLHYISDASNEMVHSIIKDPYGLIEKNYNWVTSFYDEADGNKLLGTNSGLYEADANYRIKKLYGLKDGLPDLYIYSIISANGKLWLSTNKGLACMDAATRHFTNYDNTDGLKSNEYNSNAFYKDKKGVIYFGGVNGFDAFDPSAVKTTHALNAPIATQFNVFDEPYNTDTAIALKHSISLPWNRNTFSVEISALDYANADRIKYAFYMEGSDKQWYISGSRRMVRYSGIAPGEYSLWIKTANAQNEWSSPVLLMHVNILPPFWKTWWFRISIALLLGALLALVVYIIASRRYRKKLEALQRQQEIEEVRRRLSRDIHDDIGSDLTKISILTEKIKNRSLADDIEFVGVLDKLSSHTRSVINHLGEIVWTVNPQHDNLSSMLAYFRNFINTFFEHGSICYNIDFDIPAEEVTVNPELRRNLYLVLKECLNNIMKHAFATEVHICFHCSGKAFQMMIKDNGEGIKQPAGMSFGNGMQNIRQRSMDSNCVISIDSEAEKGTIITVSGTIY